MPYIEEQETSSELREQARALGLCNQWYDEWDVENTNYKMLINMMFKGFDFCVEHDWPSVDYICQHFPFDLLEDNGVFCNVINVKARDKRNVAVLGDSRVELVYHDFGFGDVRVRHTASVTVSAEPLAIVQLHLYDTARATVYADEGAKVTVYLHGDKCSVSTHDTIKTIKEKK